jgi:hypothetical protein
MKGSLIIFNFKLAVAPYTISIPYERTSWMPYSQHDISGSRSSGSGGLASALQLDKNWNSEKRLNEVYDRTSRGWLEGVSRNGIARLLVSGRDASVWRDYETMPDCAAGDSICSHRV